MLSFPDSAREAAINNVISRGDRVIACEGAPASYTDADTLVSGGGHKLMEHNITAAAGYTGPNDETTGKSYDLDKGGFIGLENRNGVNEGVDHLVVVDDDNQEIVDMFEVDDGNGNPVGIEEDVAYNNLSITTTIGGVTAA